MTYRVTFKTPDVLDQLTDVPDSEYVKLIELIQKYFDYEEYVTIELDTESMTVTVVEK